MVELLARLRAFGNDDSGQDLIEYALIAALIGLVTVAAMQSLAGNIAGAFSSVGSTLDSSI